MASVPYSPIPQTSASGQGLPGVSSSAPSDAFGGDIARAISGLGKTVEGVGDQLFERALWLQNLNNQAEARKADADYIIRSGQLQTEFNSLEGDQATKAYPKYVQQVKALRETIKGSLSTQMSQQMFDGQTQTTMARSIFTASNHAAAAQKKYVVQSMDAQRTAIREDAARTPFDDVATERAIRRTEQSVQEEGKLRGMPPEAIDNASREATSAIYATKIESAAKENPLQAPTMLSGMRDKLSEKDFKRVENVVNNQRDAYGSAKISTDLIAAHTDEDGNLTAPMSELQAKARKLAAQFSPDDPAFAHKAVAQLNSQFNQHKYARKQENYDNRDIVNSAILGGSSSMDMLLSDPKASAAYYALPKSEQLKIPARIDNYIKARDRGANEHTMTTVMGLRNNDVESFLAFEPTDEKYRLSQSQIREVQTAQAKIKKQTSADPRVDRAMSWMRQGFGAQMEAMQVFKRTNANKAEYDHLTGAVQQALDIWQEDHKKPPTNKEFNESIAPNILKVVKEPGMFGIHGFGVFGNDRTVFRHDTGSNEFKNFDAQVRLDLKARGGSEPSDEEVYKAYTRLQLLKLYPPKGASGAK